jgi:hypothetical protein
MRYAVGPVPKQAPSYYLPGLALMATTPGRRRLSRHIEQEGGVSPKIATPRLRSAERLFCGNVQISAASVARDRTRSLTIQPMSLQR